MQWLSVEVWKCVDKFEVTADNLLYTVDFCIIAALL